MLSKLFALAAVAIAGFAIYAAFTQRSAMVLRQEQQPHYWARHNTHSSGVYRSGVWHSNPVRSSYGAFRGGGPGAGK